MLFDGLSRRPGGKVLFEIRGNMMDNEKQTDGPKCMQLLKIKSMSKFIELEFESGSKGKADDSFRVTSGKLNGLQKNTFSYSELRQEIEPWLTALFQSEHLSLLAGAGLTTAFHYGIIQNKFDPYPKIEIEDTELNKKIESASKELADMARRGEPNFEDKLRVLIKLEEGLRIIGSAQSEAIQKTIGQCLSELLNNVLQIERDINIPSTCRCCGQELRDKYLTLLVSFLMSFASRSGTRDRLNIFTTNYDRLIEFGAELAGVRLIDRFIGTLHPIFRSSRLDVDLHYNPPGIRGEPRYLEGVARFSKLHGSLDWINDGEFIRRVGLPFGANEFEPYFPEECSEALIYPRDAKDKETTNYPYVELFRDFAAAICRPNSVIVTYGYSFGDDHINRVIRDMLTIPSTHLVVISYDDIGDRIKNFYERSNRASQISLLIGKHLGEIGNLVEYFLPKPAIDRTSIKMAELLKARGLHSSPPDDTHKKIEVGENQH